MSHAKYRALRMLPALATVALMAAQTPALAALGGDAGSVQIDSVRLHGQLISTSMLQYERHDITTAAGGAVHEYLSRSGRVFAVTWQGQMPPDLRQLFGSYFEPLRAAEAAHSRPGAHRQVAIVQPDFVYQASGQLRAFRGRAYVPSLVPVGVDLSALQ